jgi:hypothetical protein
MEGDCCLTPNEQFLQLYDGENKSRFDEMIMISALIKTSNTANNYKYVVLTADYPIVI